MDTQLLRERRDDQIRRTRNGRQNRMDECRYSEAHTNDLLPSQFPTVSERVDLLLKRHEDKTLEFKRDLSSPARVIATLVAFANSAGGVVALGVEDGTRTVVGLGDPTAVVMQYPSLTTEAVRAAASYGAALAREELLPLAGDR